MDHVTPHLTVCLCDSSHRYSKITLSVPCIVLSLVFRYGPQGYAYSLHFSTSPSIISIISKFWPGALHAL